MTVTTGGGVGVVIDIVVVAEEVEYAGAAETKDKSPASVNILAAIIVKQSNNLASAWITLF